MLRAEGSELGDALRDLVARYTNRVYDDDVVDEDVPESWLARIFG